MKWFEIVNAKSVPESLGIGLARANEINDKIETMIRSDHWTQRNQAEDLEKISEWVTSPQELVFASYIYGAILSVIRSADIHIHKMYNPN